MKTIKVKEPTLFKVSTITKNRDGKHVKNDENNIVSDNIRLQVATAAMQGLLGNPKIINGCGGLEYNHEYITKHAVMYADTLIAELNMKGGCE